MISEDPSLLKKARKNEKMSNNKPSNQYIRKLHDA